MCVFCQSCMFSLLHIRHALYLPHFWWTCHENVHHNNNITASLHHLRITLGYANSLTQAVLVELHPFSISSWVADKKNQSAAQSHLVCLSKTALIDSRWVSDVLPKWKWQNGTRDWCYATPLCSLRDTVRVRAWRQQVVEAVRWRPNTYVTAIHICAQYQPTVEVCCCNTILTDPSRRWSKKPHWSFAVRPHTLQAKSLRLHTCVGPKQPVSISDAWQWHILVDYICAVTCWPPNGGRLNDVQLWSTRWEEWWSHQSII